MSNYIFLIVLLTTITVNSAERPTKRRKINPDCAYGFLPEQKTIIFSKELLDYIIYSAFNNAASVGKPTKTNQKKLVQYICTLSRLNREYHQYAHSFEYIKNLFASLRYEIRFPLIATYLLKKNNDYLKSQKCISILTKTMEANTPVSTITYYFSLCLKLSSECSSLSELEIKELLEYGADPNFYVEDDYNYYNRAPALIQLAAYDTSGERLELLLQSGADVNIRPSCTFHIGHTFSSWTALDVAIAHGNKKAVEILIQHNPKNKCIGHAFISGDETTKNIILATDLTQQELDNGLIAASSTQNINDLEQLLAKGANPHFLLHTAVNRTLDYYLHPENYTQTLPTFAHFSNNNNHTTPIPNNSIVETLCNFGGYNQNTVKQLKKLKKEIKKIIPLIEANNTTHNK